MLGLRMIPFIVMIIAVSGLIAGATILATSKFQETVTMCAEGNYTAGSGDFCVNSTEVYAPGGVGTDSLNLSEEYYIMSLSKDGASEVVSQFPTVGIIAVLVIIISLLAGVFAYMRYFG